MSDKILIGVLAFLLGSSIMIGVSVEVKKDYVNAGVMLIGDKAYRVTPMEPPHATH